MFTPILLLRKRLPALAFLLLAPCTAGAQDAVYLDHQTLQAQLQALASANAERVTLTKLAQSPGDREISVLELGAGTPDERLSRPAMLVTAGLDGTDLLGSHMALHWARKLLSNEGALLENTTIYIIPRAQPDAAEAFFAAPQQARTRDTTPHDDDRDGLVDEDGPEDLNGDGVITSMRVASPEGTFIEHPNEPRLLIPADPLKGEQGKWLVYAEGLDQDHDDRYNEDGLGGVNYNRNFTQNYQWFAEESGDYQLSAPVARALADFVIAHPNIGLAFCFGDPNNLLGDPPAAKNDETNVPATGINPKDHALYKELGKRFREALGLTKTLAALSRPGSFVDWLYFHRGRVALASPAWTPAMQLALHPPKEEQKAESEGEKKDGEDKNKSAEEKGQPDEPAKDEPLKDERAKDERAFLKWLDQTAPDSFVPWTLYPHPDFPGQTVEIGGHQPFAEIAPPASQLGDLADKHAKALSEFAHLLPRVCLQSARWKSLGKGVFDLKLQVVNTGYLATATRHGEITDEIHPNRVELTLEEGSAILAGDPVKHPLPTLAGSGGLTDVHYVLHLKSQTKVAITLVSMLGGTTRQELLVGTDYNLPKE